MKRDPNLLRDLMTFIEAQPSYTTTWTTSFKEKFPNRDVFDLGEHVKQLILSGFIEGDVHAHNREHEPKIVVGRITPAGHDFLAAVRSDVAWKRVMKDVVEQGKDWTLSLLLQYATVKAKETLGLP